MKHPHFTHIKENHMRRTILVALLAIGVASSAMAAGPVRFGLHGNAAFLNVPEPLKEAYGFGYGGGAHLDISLVVLSVRVSGDYISFPVDDGKFKTILAAGGFNPADFDIDGGTIGILSFAVNGKVSLPVPVFSPYITAGAGLASISASDLTITYQGQPYISGASPGSETKFSVNAGVGADLDILVATLFIEAKYTLIFTEGESSSYVPVTVGITF
jgi:opacity protein-like surface antigen